MYIVKKTDEIIPSLIKKIGKIINPLILKFRKESNKLLIFYFHGLYESDKQKKLNHSDPQNNITVEQFSEFIEYFLHHKYKFIKPDDLLKPLLPDQSYAMITFDDGYFNNMLATEVLNKYKVDAAFFLTTKNIIENKSFWWDIVYRNRIKQYSDKKIISKEQQYLKGFKYTEIDNYIEIEFGKQAFEPWSDIDRPFSASEIKSFIQSPFIHIGNHTHNHTLLSNYARPEIENEFKISNQILFELTGKMPTSTAFPNGNFNKMVLDMAEEAGFQFAFTTQNDVNILPVANERIICLNRLMAKAESIRSYGSFIRLGYNADHLYINLKKRLRSLNKTQKRIENITT